MYYLHKATSAVSCVKPNASLWEATFCDDVGFPTVYRRIYRCKFLTLSNQTSRCIRKCIRMKYDRSGRVQSELNVWPQWVKWMNPEVNEPRSGSRAKWMNIDFARDPLWSYLNKFRKKSSSLLIFTLFFSRSLERTSHCRLHEGQADYIWIVKERRRHHDSSSIQSNLRKCQLFWRHVTSRDGGMNYTGFYRFL